MGCDGFYRRGRAKMAMVNHDVDYASSENTARAFVRGLSYHIYTVFLHSKPPKGRTFAGIFIHITLNSGIFSVLSGTLPHYPGNVRAFSVRSVHNKWASRS